MRVERSFAFVDLCGFTSFAEQHGDECVVVFLAELRTALREAAARRGVRIAKWLGDGAMISATNSDALVALVVEISQRMHHTMPSLPIRAGMATGPVIMFEGDDYIGYPVNVAARLCQRAQPREVLATVDVAASRPSWVRADPATSVIVRGLVTAVDTRTLHLDHPGDDPVIDPVCGLTIAAAHATHAGGVAYCSQACATATPPIPNNTRSVPAATRPDATIHRP